MGRRRNNLKVREIKEIRGKWRGNRMQNGRKILKWNILNKENINNRK
jgi:hypothetical protein